jgi:hypothetical protein
MKKLTVLVALIFSAIIFIISCHKDDMPTNDGGSGNSLRTTVCGIVLDESNAPVNNATAAAYGQTTTTNQYGIFVLKNLNVNKDRCVLQIAKAGFFNRAHGFIASANTVNYVRIILVSNAATQNFSSSAGGTVSLPDGSSALFQANSFVTTSGSAYTGTVNIAFKHLSTDDANFGFMIPGGDLAGKDLNNKDVALYTYGMLGVVLTGNSGEALQLATGTTATLTFAIAAFQTATAPASIPLWYLDETTSLWKEQGTANKVGNNYVGTVTHFSWWNCDYCGPKAYFKGRVVDCNGVPVPNIVVSLNGVAYTITDQNGEYSDWIPSGLTMTINLQVLASNNNGIISNSQVETVPMLSTNQTFIVPDLVVPCPSKVTGVIKTCAGENTNGIVSLSDGNGLYSFQYTLSGAFEIATISNSQVFLDAYDFTTATHQTITTLSAPNILNVGNILLCDTIDVSGNNFIINGDGFTNDTVQILVSSTSIIYADWDGDGTGEPEHPYLAIYGYGLSQNVALQIGMADTFLVSHNFSNLYINISIGNKGYSSISSPQGTLSLLNYPVVNSGNIAGTFSGILYRDSAGTFIPVTISNGHFSLLRDN